MRAAASHKLLLGLFAVLAVGSVGLKAAAGPPQDGLSDARPGEVEQQLAERLRSQGFSTVLRKRIERSSTVLAALGDCRISVRDARGGAAFTAVFATDAKAIGPVRYLFRGKSYGSPPTMAMRFARLESEVKSRFGFDARASVPVALAASPGCGRATFGLEDVRIAA